MAPEAIFSGAEHQHEQVVFCHDHETDLKAVIGIHNTVLGPAGRRRVMASYSDMEPWAGGNASRAA
jgi:leucine dehydrogenase